MKTIGSFAMPNPFVLGHEGAGAVVSVSSNVTNFNPGSYIALLGTNAYLTHPYLGVMIFTVFPSFFTLKSQTLTLFPFNHDIFLPFILSFFSLSYLLRSHDQDGETRFIQTAI